MENENDSGTNSENDGGAINPAWNDLLALIPEENHDQAIPHLQGWDRGVQDRFQQVQSEWSDFKFLKENEISPDDTRIALGLLRAVQEDPENVYNSLAEAYEFGAKVESENQTQEGQGEAEGFQLPPEIADRISRLENQNNMLAEILVAQKQKEEKELEDNQLQMELGELRKAHGNFDEKFVLAHMQNGASAEDAVKAYQGLVEQVKLENARPPAPRLLGSNSNGIPGEKPLDPTKLSNNQVKSLVADYLKAHNAANQ